MSVRVSPRGAWVLLQPEKRPVQGGGIYLSATTHGETAIVLDPGVFEGVPFLRVGDRVLFDLGQARGAGVDNPGLVLIPFEHIRAVLALEGEN